MKRFQPFFALCLLAAIAHPATAQDDKPAPVTAAPADTSAVMANVYDLALLRALQSVNLDEAQIKLLRGAVKETLEKDKARRKKDADALMEIAPDLQKAKADALAGEPIPTSIVTRVVDMQKAYLARLGEAKREAVESILTAFYPTLSATQKVEIEKQTLAFYGGKRVPAAYRSEPKKAPREEVLKLAAGGFVENVLLDDRMPALLDALQPLKDAAKSGDAAPAPDTVPAKP